MNDIRIKLQPVGRDTRSSGHALWPTRTVRFAQPKRCRRTRMPHHSLRGCASACSTQPTPTPRRELLIVALFTAIITIVSVDDVYWSFKNQAVLYEVEQNPVGRWLMTMDGGDVALFMTAKLVLTMVVISAVPLLYRFRSHWGLTIGGAVAAFQLLLFAYLNFGDWFPVFTFLN